jgi:hypothetical protein
MRAKDLFGRRVKFEETFSDVAYVKDEPADFSRKLYEGDDFERLVAPVNPVRDADTKSRPPASFRKVVFSRTSGEGIIIGQTSKHEGLYDPGTSEAQPSLERKRTHTFWVVAVGINKTVLAEKSSTVLVK